MTETEAAELRERLAAAERVCLMYGWTGSVDDSDRDKAAHELWLQWCETPASAWTLQTTPDLSDEYIAELARKRDATRAATLARLGLTET